MAASTISSTPVRADPTASRAAIPCGRGGDPIAHSRQGPGGAEGRDENRGDREGGETVELRPDRGRHREIIVPTGVMRRIGPTGN
jgi:hypothetical protein